MDFLSVVWENWFDAVQTLALVSSGLLGAYYLRDEAKQRRITNEWEITKQHTQLWLHRLSNHNLARIEATDRNLRSEPITDDERIFIHLLILLLAKSYKTAKAEMFTLPKGLSADISTFFASPIPRHVWQENKRFLDQDFVQFVESRL